MSVIGKSSFGKLTTDFEFIAAILKSLLINPEIMTACLNEVDPNLSEDLFGCNYVFTPGEEIHVDDDNFSIDVLFTSTAPYEIDQIPETEFVNQHNTTLYFDYSLEFNDSANFDYTLSITDVIFYSTKPVQYSPSATEDEFESADDDDELETGELETDASKNPEDDAFEQDDFDPANDEE